MPKYLWKASYTTKGARGVPRKGGVAAATLCDARQKALAGR